MTHKLAELDKVAGHTHPYSRLCNCNDCFEAYLDGAGERSPAERAEAWKRVVDMIDAMPKRPGPSVEAARERADNAVRGLLSDPELLALSKTQRTHKRDKAAWNQPVAVGRKM